jgi:DNA-binding transcriptional LysR family regulator
MAIDWEGIRLFAAIADAGSLTRAAERTGVSQPTLSRKLKELEDNLGAALFERLPSQLVLTTLGGQLIDMARVMSATAEGLERKAQGLVRSGHMPVRVSATMTVSTLLAHNIVALSEAASRHACELQIETTRAATSLVFREADIAIRHRHYPPEGHMRVRRLGALAFCIYGPAHAKPAGIVGLVQDRPPPQPGWVDDYASRESLPVLARTSEFHLRQEAAAAGLGATLLPCIFGDRDKRLRRFGQPIPELEEDIFMLMRDEPGAQPGIRAVADQIFAIFRGNAAALAGAA